MKAKQNVNLENNIRSGEKIPTSKTYELDTLINEKQNSIIKSTNTSVTTGSLLIRNINYSNLEECYVETNLLFYNSKQFK